jgi:hypothetical protein
MIGDVRLNGFGFGDCGRHDLDLETRKLKNKGLNL